MPECRGCHKPVEPCSYCPHCGRYHYSTGEVAFSVARALVATIIAMLAVGLSCLGGGLIFIGGSCHQADMAGTGVVLLVAGLACFAVMVRVCG